VLVLKAPLTLMGISAVWVGECRVSAKSEVMKLEAAPVSSKAAICVDA